MLIAGLVICATTVVGCGSDGDPDAAQGASAQTSEMNAGLGDAASTATAGVPGP